MAISNADLNWALMNGGGMVVPTENGLQWRSGGESGGDARDITQADIESLRDEQRQSFARQSAGYNSNPAFQQFTPDQVKEYQAYVNNQTSAPAWLQGGKGIYNAKNGDGGTGMWWGPLAAPHHTDNGSPLSFENLMTGQLNTPYGETAQSAWNDMRNGAAIMALPFAAAGGAALAGAGGAGAAGAGATGVDASTGLFAGETAASGSAGAGAYGGGVSAGGSNMLLADAAGVPGGTMTDATAVDTPLPDETGAFDMYGSNSGAPGGQPGSVFDYSSPSTNYAQMAQDWAKQLGITPAAALQMLIKGVGRAAPGALGAVAASKQTDQFQRLADQYSGYGAPYRERLASLYADPSSFLKSAEVTAPVQQASDIAAHSLSTGGNPIASGNSLQQLQDYSANQLFGRLGQEKDRLAGFGGLTQYNAAAPGAANNAINSGSNVYNAIGSGVANVFNPPQTLAQQMAEFQRLSSGTVR